jgi:membrane protein DedA with SNARE-associated domain
VTLAPWADGPLAYLGILFAAAVEGEVAYVTAAVLVGQGYLDPLGVLLAGSAGASLGDQFYFYLFRGRVHRWIDRWEMLARRGRLLVRPVRRHAVPMVFIIRFAPGLRIALSAACAYADVPPVTFSVVNMAASVVWGAALLGLVAWAGPTYLTSLGLSGWWAALIPAALVLTVYYVAARLDRHLLPPAGSRPDGAQP